MLTCVKKALHKSQGIQSHFNGSFYHLFWFGITWIGFALHRLRFIWIEAIRLIYDINIFLLFDAFLFPRWATKKKTRYITYTIFHLPFFSSPFPRLKWICLVRCAHFRRATVYLSIYLAVASVQDSTFHSSKSTRIRFSNWACAGRVALDFELWLFQSNFQHWNTQNAYLIWLCLSKALLSICAYVLLFITQTLLQLLLLLLLLSLSLQPIFFSFFSRKKFFKRLYPLRLW